MEKVTTVGIDLAKRVFALHGVDGTVRPTPGHPEHLTGSFRCRLTCEDRARGFHQGQSKALITGRL
jgi:hypothetical protein